MPTKVVRVKAHTRTITHSGTPNKGSFSAHRAMTKQPVYREFFSGTAKMSDGALRRMMKKNKK